MPRQAQAKQRPSTTSKEAQSRRPLQKLLLGFAMTFFGASMLLPFKDDSAGLAAVFKLLFSFNPLNWLFLICSWCYLRLIFRLHEAKLPILKAFLILLGMCVAVLNLYFFRNGTVGVGIVFWLASGFILFAAATRWRYPTGGLKSSFVAFILFTWLSIWGQGVYKSGKATDIWDDAVVAADGTKIQPNPNGEPAIGVSSDAVPENASAAAKPNELSQQSVVQVERDWGIYNPWNQQGAVTNCDTVVKQNYPVLLPPRYLEDGYEWRNYQHGDTTCNTLLTVGTLTKQKQGDFRYKVWQDRRSNIYVMMSNKQDNALFNEHFTITRDTNGLEKSDYAKKFNEQFAHMVDDQGKPEVDGEYVFSKAETPNVADSLASGCALEPVKNRPNTYRWGTGRVNFRGQSILQPQTFCSKKNVGMVHVSNDLQAAEQGQQKLLPRLFVKLFNAHNLKPIQCGAVSIPVNPSIAQAWQSGQLKAENIQIDPANTSGCLNIRVKLSNGTVLNNEQVKNTK